MVRRLLPFLLVLLVACTLPDDVLITPTPTGGPSSTETPSPTETQPSTDVPATNTPGLASPTPLCVEGICNPPTPGATPVGQEEWEYTILGYHQIQCVAGACNARSVPRIYGSVVETYPKGTVLDVLGVYHCEVYSYCDDIVEWWYVREGEYAAALPDVWADITPGE